MTYWCQKCDQPIQPVEGKINHLHEGEVHALVCPKCGAQAVNLNDKRKETA